MFSSNLDEWPVSIPILDKILNKADLFIPLNVDNPKNGEFLKSLTGTSVSLTETFYHLIGNTKINTMIPIFEAQSLFKTSKSLEIHTKNKNLYSTIIFGSNDLT